MRDRYIILLLFACMSACSGDPSAAPAGSDIDAGTEDVAVEVDRSGEVVLALSARPDPVMLRVGQSTGLSVRARTETDEFEVQPTFRVDDTDIATVNPQGTITGVAEGTTFIEASWMQRQVVVSVDVRGEFVAALDLIPRTVELGPGEFRQVRVQTSPPGVDVELAWSVDEPELAAFDSETLELEGLSPGETTLRGSGRGVDAQVRVTVRGDPSELVAGDFHTCARVSESIFCWGSNDSGQLGHSENGAGRVDGVFTSVAAGGRHTCGIADDATRCWGDNSDGQLGAEPAMGFAQIGPEFQFVEISAGQAHTCALDASGSAFCWGANESGQLGVGDLVMRASPTRVDSGARFSQISAGRRHTCAIDVEDDRLWCWGSNRVGQLATTDEVSAESPRRVASMNSYLAVSAGGLHTCAISSTQTPQCWGSNEFGQLGDGTTTDRTAPIFVSSPVGYVRLSAGSDATCGASTAGGVECWGDSRQGQGGAVDPRQNELPVTISAPNSDRANRVAVGEDHICAVWGDEVWCWGGGSRSQLNTESGNATTPVRIDLF